MQAVVRVQQETQTDDDEVSNDHDESDDTEKGSDDQEEESNASNATEGSGNDAADTSDEDLFHVTDVKRVKESSEIEVSNWLLVNFSGNPKSCKLYRGQVDLPFGSTAFQGTFVKNKSRRVCDATLFFCLP